MGNTLFTSTAAAYEALPDSTKCRIDKLKAVNSSKYYTAHHEQQKGGGAIELTEKLKQATNVEQPVVRTHPITGRKCIFVTESHTKYIVGLEPQESEDLLRELLEQILRPEFIYTHSWRVGDLLIWDNAATQHRATFDYALPLRRLMYRTATVGPPPF